MGKFALILKGTESLNPSKSSSGGNTLSDRNEEISVQTEIRHRLLANGYSPVPNYDKRCFMVGRNDVAIDKKMIDLWSTQLKHLSTAVRIEGKLVAIDIQRLKLHDQTIRLDITIPIRDRRIELDIRNARLKDFLMRLCRKIFDLPHL